MGYISRWLWAYAEAEAEAGNIQGIGNYGLVEAMFHWNRPILNCFRITIIGNLG